jgi:hypothetical protein
MPVLGCSDTEVDSFSEHPISAKTPARERRGEHDGASDFYDTPWGRLREAERRAEH